MTFDPVEVCAILAEEGSALPRVVEGRTPRLTGLARQRWRAPVGDKTQLRIFIDPDLLQCDEVWAAAGTWHDVFGIEPRQSVEASEGPVTDLKRG